MKSSLWFSLQFASSEDKMSFRHLTQLNTGNACPRWQGVSFCLARGCSRTCYLQGVQPTRSLAHLCLLAVQGGQELPSHPETKKEVKGFVHYWENVLKCNQVSQQNVILIHPDLIPPTEEQYHIRAAQGYGTITACHTKKIAPFLHKRPIAPVWALTNVTVCYITELSGNTASANVLICFSAPHPISSICSCLQHIRCSLWLEELLRTTSNSSLCFSGGWLKCKHC